MRRFIELIFYKEDAAMAGWQEELANLLHELGVTQEEPPTHLRSTGKSTRNDTRWYLHSGDAFPSDDVSRDDSESWLMDLDAMRREVDSIVKQVTQLIQHGELDQSLKDDVMIVLRALRRRSTVTQQAASGDEAYLESVAAMLHFCRLVLRLSETTIEDF
jgi:hypothetical protein